MLIICVDYDGTLVKNSFPGPGELQDDAKRVMKRFHDAGVYLILWTCRMGQYLQDAITLLQDNDIHIDSANSDHAATLDDFVREYHSGSIPNDGTNGRKVFGHFYIDDRIVGGFPGWKKVENYFESIGVLPITNNKE